MSTEYLLSTVETQKKLIEIWEDILNIDHVGINDNFLELGGNSLKAIKLELRINQEFNIEISIDELFNNFTVSELAEYLCSSEKNINIQFKLIPIEKKEYYPMSSIQKSMYILNQNQNIGTTYNIYWVGMLQGKLDKIKFEYAFSEIIKRHESFRTSFELKNGEFIQKISNTIDFTIDYFANQLDAAKETVKEYIRPFDLLKAPLIRCALIKITNIEDNYVLAIDMHHIISDSISVGILLHELKSIYEGIPLPEHKIHYKDYTIWYNSLIENNELIKQESYWDRIFSNGVPVLDMPLDYKRTNEKTFNGGIVRFKIDDVKTDELNRIALEQGTTLNIILMSLYALVLYKYTKQSSNIIGSIMSGRELLNLNNVIGIFPNYLPIKFIFDEEMTLNNYISACKNNIIEAYSNRKYPFEKMVQKYANKTRISRNPLFDTAINFHNEDSSENINSLGDLEVSYFDYNKSTTSSLDFMIHIFEESRGLLFLLNYNTDLFKDHSMELLCSKIIYLVDYFIENPFSKISEFEIFTDEEYLDIKTKQNYEYFEKKEKVNLNIVSTFVSEPIKKYIQWWDEKLKINAKISFSPYNQVFQELIDQKSITSTNNGINLILFRPEDWIVDRQNTNDYIIKLEELFFDFIDIITKRNRSTPHIYGLFPVSMNNGFSDRILEYLKSLNDRFKQYMKGLKNVFIIDFNEVLGLYKIKNVFDPYKEKISHMPFSDEYYAAIGTYISRWIYAFYNQIFKVIILDCDNTLWKGICAEEGPENVRIEGPYKSIQEFLVKKYNEGFLLVLCSKNNEADVWNVFEKNKQMLLKKEHIAHWEINWDKKSSNIKKIASKLNLSLDSFIFLDDNIYECWDVMENCPQVLTLNLPEKQEYIPLFLNHVWAFDKFKVLEEDKKRSQMYLQERKRQELKTSNITINEYLQKLDIKVYMNIMTDYQFDRAYQLLQRTNQFNNKGNNKLTEKDFKILINSSTTCYSIEVSDKFGDYGLTGVIVVKEDNDTLHIDTFSLSCRILGRGIEEAIFNQFMKICIENKIKYIEVDFYSSEKNNAFYMFLNKLPIHSIYDNDIKHTYKIYLSETQVMEENVKLIYMTYKYTSHTEHYQKYITENINLNNDRNYSEFEIINDDKKLWKVNLTNEDNLLHKSQYLPLIYFSPKLVINFNDCEVGFEDRKSGSSDVIENELIKIWEEILNISNITSESNFLNMGGNSIDAARAISSIYKILNIEITFYEFFKYSTIKELAQYLRSIDKNIDAHIKKVTKRDYYPLSLSQKAIYTLSYQFKNTNNLNNPFVYIIEGQLDKKRMESVFLELVDRHEAFRTSFDLINETPVQKIFEKVDFSFFDYEILEKDIDTTLKSLVTPFDITQPPLFRAGLLSINENKHVLFFDAHHIIFDGVSLGIMLREINELYNGKELELPVIQNKDFAVWQNEVLDSSNILKQKTHWLDIYKDEIPSLLLPFDFLKLNETEYIGECIESEIPDFILKKLNLLSKELSITLHNLLFSSYALLLSKYNGQNDIVIGSISMGRNYDELQSVIGNFTNVLPVKFNINNNVSIDEYLQKNAEMILIAYDNQNFPVWEVLSEITLQNERRQAANPFFDTMFLFHNQFFRNMDLEIEGLQFKSHGVQQINSRYDIQMEATQWGEEKLNLRLEYNKNLFKYETIDGLLRHFILLLEKIVDNHTALISDTNILDEDEIYRIINDFNQTRKFEPFNKTIHELFEEQVVLHPHSVAVVDGDNKITYEQLNYKANAIAHLIKNKGICENDVVGILFDRNLEMIISILGVLKAGAAYLPIDTSSPEDRIKYIIEDSNAKLFLTQESEQDKIIGSIEFLNVKEYIETIDVKLFENMELILNPYRLFYIIYTSGTTGMPKGVMVKAHPFENLINWYCNEFNINYEDVFLLISSIGFDLTQKNLFAPLVTGGQLVLYNERIFDSNLAVKLIYDKKVTITNCSPSLFNTLIECSKDDNFECLKSLKDVFLGGEPINDVPLLQWVNSKNCSAQIVNTYGPTECTDVSSFYILKTSDFTSNNSIPIGKPIQNVKMYILDNDMNFVPINAEGEIYIGGLSLARGYINNIEYTNSKFIANKYQANEILYKTGDLAKWRSDGNIEFIGRKDHQIKIRGYRIELGEIEFQLRSLSDLKDVVVVDKVLADNQKYICAYYISESKISSKDLRRFLKKKLPEYMLPSYYIPIDKIPLNCNGKINRGALPEPQFFNMIVKNEVVENLIEERLVKIWKEVLSVEFIGTKDDFFLFGGNSMKAIILVSKIRKELSRDIPVSEVFNNPTIKELANYLQSIEENEFQDIKKAEERNYYPASSVQKRLYFISEIDHIGIGYNMPIGLRIHEFLDLVRLKKAFIMLINRHESLRTSFDIIEDEVVQIIHEKVEFEIEEFEAGADGIDHTIACCIRFFDLKIAPLFRVAIIRIDSDNVLLVIDMHHIISDAVSLNIICKELFELYEGKILPDLMLQYKDFSVWQKSMIESSKIKRQQEYWSEHLKGKLPQLNIPLDFQRTEIQDFEGQIVEFTIDSEITRKIEEISHETNTTIYMILFTAYCTLLANYTCQEDIIIGAILSGRTHINLENIVGMFVNTLPVRTYPIRSKTFKNLLLELKETLLKTYENQEYQLDDIINNLKIKREPGRMPLFDTVFSYLENEKSLTNANEVQGYELQKRISKFDFTLYVYYHNRQINCELEYCSKLFSQNTMKEFTEQFKTVLNAVSEDIHIKLNEIDLVSAKLQTYDLDNVVFNF